MRAMTLALVPSGQPSGNPASAVWSLASGHNLYSNPIQTWVLNRVSMQANVIGDGTPAGSLAWQVSDDFPPLGTEWTPGSVWQPTNWSTLDASVTSVTATGLVFLSSTDFCSRFIRLAWIPQTDGTGSANTFTANAHFIGWGV